MGRQTIGTLVLGGRGLLGGALRAVLASRGRAHEAPGRDALELAAVERITEAIEALAPSAVINAAAFTDVAAAEEAERRDEVFLLNRDVPEALAIAARRLSIPFVHVSTDYVFDGTKGAPYDEDDPPRPIQVYGLSKLEGERRVLAAYPHALVVRTSTLYGPTERARLTYVDAIVDQAKHRSVIEVVELPVSSPTYAPDLAGALVDLLDRGATGTVHAANAGSCSRLELARAIVRGIGRGGDVEVRARPAPAEGLKRPACSALALSRLESILGRRPRSWNEALDEYLAAACKARSS